MTTLALAALMISPPAGTFPVRFEYIADRELQSVTLAGQFNNWNKAANPMTRTGSAWSTTINLKPGEHQYKFVLNDTEWIADPRAKSQVDDGFGNTNSVVLVQPPEYLEKPGREGDGVLTISALRHVQEVPQLNYDRGSITLTFHARARDVSSVLVRVNGNSVAMTKASEDQLVARYTTRVPWNRRDNFQYQFQLNDGTVRKFFGPKGADTHSATAGMFQLDAMTFQPFEVPSWVEGTVFYQIFPDRFDNANKETDPPKKEAWTAEPTYWNRFGGDAAGVRRRIPYLRRLGVNGVYFNPVMKAPSYHRYDPVDFYRVDPEFGTNQEFIDLTHQMHGQGIRVVLDQIFDHVGVTFAPFADVLRFQQESRYRDWFFIKEFPVEVRPNPPYVGWFGTEWMPKVNLANRGVYNYLMESVDFWMAQAKLSGWRLDVANEVPQWFWQDFRKRVKKIDSDAWIVGEVWYDASPWLRGDQWDASMNYPFRDVVLRFLAHDRTTPTQFAQGLMNVYTLYAPQVSRNQMNLISSHDTPRFITEARGDRQRAALAAIVQMTWVGTPSIYYGEEIGMEGGADPQNRRGMRWDKVKGNELLGLYAQLIHLRTTVPVLAKGDPMLLNQFDSAGVATFARHHGDDFLAVAINRNKNPFTGTLQLPKNQAGKEFVNALSGETVRSDAQGRLSVRLEPFSAFVGLNASHHHRNLVRAALAASAQAKDHQEPMP